LVEQCGEAFTLQSAEVLTGAAVGALGVVAVAFLSFFPFVDARDPGSQRITVSLARAKANERFRANDGRMRPGPGSAPFILGVIESDEARERCERRLRELAARLGVDPP